MWRRVYDRLLRLDHAPLALASKIGESCETNPPLHRHAAVALTGVAQQDIAQGNQPF